MIYTLQMYVKTYLSMPVDEKCKNGVVRCFLACVVVLWRSGGTHLETTLSEQTFQYRLLHNDIRVQRPKRLPESFHSFQFRTFGIFLNFSSQLVIICVRLCLTRLLIAHISSPTHHSSASTTVRVWKTRRSLLERDPLCV